MGGKLMLTFGIGAIPAIWITQIATSWVDGKLSGSQLQTGRKVLAGLAAVSLVWHFVFPVVLLAGKGESLPAGKPACQCDLKFNPAEE